MSPKEELLKYRSDIDDIDEKILKLVKEREMASAKIGQIKRTLKVADKDFSREKQVFHNVIKMAKKLNLPENHVISLQKKLMQISLFRQQKDRIMDESSAESFTITIVGGSGRMGKWFGNFFLDMGHKVNVVDPVKPDFACPYSENIEDFLAKSHVIVLAAPIRQTQKILEELKSCELKNKYVFDISSVKNPLKPSLEALAKKGALVTSLHPMFGAKAEYLFGKNLIITSLGCKKADDFAKGFFEATSLNIVEMNFDEHDKMVSFLLSLTHLLNLLFGEVIAESGYSSKELQSFSSTTFNSQAFVAQKVFGENPYLYYEIQSLNPFNEDMMNILSTCLTDLQRVLEKKDEELFAQRMKFLRGYFEAISSHEKS